jgi:methylphosphotriester-DNA--protein-cysteine methyltransferase
MIEHSTISKPDLISQIKAGKITLGGNKYLKIYGLLTCKSGKRMKKQNRVFFTSELEALQKGFRPCGHCMKITYHNYKNAP